MTSLVLLAASVVSFGNTATPQQALTAAHQQAGFQLYVPDSAAIGYKLTEVEVATISGRKVVHIKFVNAKAMNSFDLLEASSQDSSAPDSDLRAILSANVFPVSAAEGDILVSIKKGKTDVMMVGSLMSAPSAKKMLERSTIVKS